MEKLRFLQCDICPGTFVRPGKLKKGQGVSAKHLQAAARKDGWGCTEDVDLCPGCLKAKIASPYDASHAQA